jgi:hypothetical protein
MPCLVALCSPRHASSCAQDGFAQDVRSLSRAGWSSKAVTVLALLTERSNVQIFQAVYSSVFAFLWGCVMLAFAGFADGAPRSPPSQRALPPDNAISLLSPVSASDACSCLCWHGAIRSSLWETGELERRCEDRPGSASAGRAARARRRRSPRTDTGR